MTITVCKDTHYLWVARAAAKKHDVRFYLQYLVVEKDRTMATDGHRLHIFTGRPLFPVGFYKITGLRKTSMELEKIEKVDFQYPKIDPVIPAKAVKPVKLNALREDAWFCTMMEMNNKMSIDDLIKDGYYVTNFDYFVQAKLYTPKEKEKWELTPPANSGAAVRLDSGPLTAILMPMRGANPYVE